METESHSSDEFVDAKSEVSSEGEYEDAQSEPCDVEAVDSNGEKVDDVEELSEIASLDCEKSEVLAMECKNVGNSHFREGQFEEALESYTQALKHCTSDMTNNVAALLGNRAAVYINLEEWDKCISDCCHAIRFDGEYMKAYYRRGRAYEAQGKLSEAINDMKKVLEIDGEQETIVVKLRELEVRLAEKQEQEKQEMLSQLKELGNKFLGHFGLSTENFHMQQDPNSGSYSVNFKK